MNSQRALTTRSLALLPSLALAVALVVACRKDNGDGSAAAPSASASSSTESPSGASATAWSPSPSTSFPEDASLGNEPLDGEEQLDASFGDAPDAPDGDAKRQIDAPDDAPLMGTKTYPDEEPVSGFRYVTSDAAKVHKAPKDGKAFLSLQRGSQVWLLGRYFDWYRIKFEDPSLGVVRQGWIFHLNVVGPRMKSCPESWIHHDEDGGWCERECTKNTDCKALSGWKCSGTGCFYAVQ